MSHWRAAPPKPLTDFKLHLILDEDDFASTLPKEGGFKMAFDFETSSLSPLHGNIVGFSYSFDGLSGYYIPVQHNVGENCHFSFPVEKIFEVMKKAKVVYAYNVRFEARWLKVYSHLNPRLVKFFDSKILVFNMDSNVKHNNMKWASLHYLGYKCPTYKEITEDVEDFSFVDPKVAYEYASLDSIMAYLLATKLGPILMKECPFILKIDNGLLMNLLDMEDTNIPLSEKVLVELYDETSVKIDNVLSECHAMTGSVFNPGSARQVSDILISFGLDTGEKTKSGDLVTRQEYLEKIDHPLPQKIAEYRRLLKLRGSYVEVLLKAAKSGQVRFNYNDTRVPSGRFAAGGDKKNPYFMHLNIQSLPKGESLFWKCREFDGDEERSKKMKTTHFLGWEFSTDKDFEGYRIEGLNRELNIRRAFKAPDGFLFFHEDYSSQELRLTANLSKEPSWVGAFNSGSDLHKAVAIKVFGEENYNKDKRKIAKIVNFSSLYGATAYTLAKTLNCPIEEAEKFLNAWMKAVPGIINWMNFVKINARKRGSVFTPFGRPRRVMEYYSQGWKMQKFGDRTAVNTIVQGGAADLIRIFLNKVGSIYSEYTEDMIFVSMIHDEYNNYIREIKVAEIGKKLLDAARFVHPDWPVEMFCDFDIGLSWGELFGFHFNKNGKLEPSHEV